MITELHHVLASSAAAHANRPALISADGETYTFAAFIRLVEALAGSLRAAGLQPGERVGLFLNKHPLACALPYAASLAGGVFVPINPALKALQVGHIMHDAEPALLLTSPERLALLDKEISRCSTLRAVLTTEATHASHHGAVEIRDWRAAEGSSVPIDEVRHPQGAPDLAALLYTSGSTGASKGVMVTHENLLTGCRSVSRYLELVSDDRVLAVLPFSFDYGLNQLLAAHYVGACCVAHEHLLARDVLRVLKAQEITGLAGVPTLWAQIANAGVSPYDGLRYFTNSGGHLPVAVLEALRRQFPRAAPYLMYGLTEAFRSTYLPPALVDERPGSIGKAVPEAEILVLKPDGTPAGANEEGELVHCGPLVTQGYWRAPRDTAQRFRSVPGRHLADGTPEIGVWSGDIVRLDDDGFLYFVGRRDGLIKTSGYRVSPDEIEEVAYKVAGVGASCAFAVADDALGQRLLLAVCASEAGRSPLGAVEAACRRELPAFMMPSEIFDIGTIPLNANGKPDRAALATAYLDKRVGGGGSASSVQQG